jgi:hypothetical protein
MVNAVGKQYSEADRAYLAGFLDADGAIMALIEKHSEKKFGHRVRICLKVTQRDRDVLDWLMNTFQVGYIRKNRSVFDWEIKGQEDSARILDIVCPYIRAKKRQSIIAKKILAIDIQSKKNLLRKARLADSLSRFNVRSKNRRRNFASMI